MVSCAVNQLRDRKGGKGRGRPLIVIIKAGAERSSEEHTNAK
jgi:hypothetical protein